jgi:hypothetical protein
MERLYSRLKRDPKTGCLEWQGATNSQGRGNIKIDGKVYQVHRVAWALEYGDIPPGVQILHKCDNPVCVELSHLFPGNATMNMLDMYNKGRHDVIRANAVLTDEEVRAIRADKRNSIELAPIYGIHSSTIRRIRRRETYAHVA